MSTRVAALSDVEIYAIQQMITAARSDTTAFAKVHVSIGNVVLDGLESKIKQDTNE